MEPQITTDQRKQSLKVVSLSSRGRLRQYIYSSKNIRWNIVSGEKDEMY